MLKFCSAPWDTIYINEGGGVGLCLCPGWNNKGLMGNILHNSLNDIFKSHSVNDFRNSIIDQSFKYCNSMCGKLWHLDQVESFPTNTPTLPTTIYLQIDKNCNLRCASCRTGNIYSAQADPIVEQILSKITEEYQNFSKPVLLYCDGLGDIFASVAYQQFMRNDRLPKCFKFCFTTNGNLISKNIDLLKSLKEKGQLSDVVVSFDAATAETYKEIRGGNFDLVIAGVKQLLDLGVTVSTQNVVQQRNYLEILDYVTLGKELGVAFSGMQAIGRFPHMTDAWWQSNRLTDNPNVDINFLINALTEIKQDSNCGICGDLESILASATKWKISV